VCVRSANQPPAAFGCQPPALCTQCIRTVLRTALHRLSINAYSTILTGHVPGFPPGHSTVVFCDLSDIYSISSLPESIEPPFLTALLLSPDPFVISITDQITDPLLALYIRFPAQQAYPSPIPRNMPLFREVLLFYGVCHGTAKS
jgi:hypothetical protein